MGPRPRRRPAPALPPPADECTARPSDLDEPASAAVHTFDARVVLADPLTVRRYEERQLRELLRVLNPGRVFVPFLNAFVSENFGLSFAGTFFADAPTLNAYNAFSAYPPEAGERTNGTRTRRT